MSLLCQPQPAVGALPAAHRAPALTSGAPGSRSCVQCFQCWEDAEQGCINMITEFFTSGSLR